LTSLPLENDGDPGSAGVHWERAVFGNEAMTASDMNGGVFSQFTLRIFEASGWYIPDYLRSQPFQWGAYEGCPFVI